jgi:hypothetical protein
VFIFSSTKDHKVITCSFLFFAHPALVCAISLQLSIARVLLELILVDLGKLRASKALSCVAEGGADLVDCSSEVGNETRQQVRKFLDGELQAVTHEVVALEKGLRIEDTISQFLGIDTNKAVGCTGVATNAGELEVLEQLEGRVLVKEQNIVRVKLVASVPVFRDTLITRGVLEVAVITGDGVERLKHLAVQLAGRIFGRLVAHETVDEAPRCRLSDHTREGGVEEVGIALNILLEAGSSPVSQQLEIVVVVCLAGVVEGLEVLHLQEIVLAVNVQITSSRRCITLVLVVRAADTLGLTKKVDGRHIWCGTTNTPGHQIAVDRSSVDSKDGRQIDSHAENLACRRNKLINGSNTIVRKVVVLKSSQHDSHKWIKRVEHWRGRSGPGKVRVDLQGQEE